MKKIVWKNKSNNQLCVTIPAGSDIKEGDMVNIGKYAVQRVAYIPVVCDLFHYGHLRAIKHAREQCDYLVCGVLSDSAAEQVRAKPVMNLKERKAVLQELKAIDRVVVQKSVDPTQNLKELHHEFSSATLVLVYGSDWKDVPAEDFLHEVKGELMRAPYYNRLSTVKIANRLAASRQVSKDLVDFAALISGTVGTPLHNQKIISTKANTLQALKPILKKSRVEDMYLFTVSDWKNDQEGVISSIQERFFGQKVVVRSSAVSEDSIEESKAGEFESILDVVPHTDAVRQAVNAVIASYRKKGADSSFNQVLVQRQSENIAMSGVVFTRTLENGPYYVINYDSITGGTNTVTAGKEGHTVYLLRGTTPPPHLAKLLDAVKEIELLVPGMGLDIEFGMNDDVIIYQVRPMVTAGRHGNDEQVRSQLAAVRATFTEHNKPLPHLHGESTIFADMPDWNPAEIIGDRPHILDYSLYDYLITDSAWHEARTSQGYADVNPAKLVVRVGNKPYVDVRKTFNSFIPGSVPNELRAKLVSFFLNKLRENPHLQDKVEFEILFTCYDFDFVRRAEELRQRGFSDAEIVILRKSLLDLTNTLVRNYEQTVRTDLSSLDMLHSNSKQIQRNVNMTDTRAVLQAAQQLLADARAHGTVQFSRLARLAFIGKILLNSLVHIGLLAENRYHEFMNSVSTVATELTDEFVELCAGNVTTEQFIKKYGHLRPGTYDITSLRYDKNPSLLSAVNARQKSAYSAVFELTAGELAAINEALKRDGLQFTAEFLFRFIRASLEARELSKFEFTKTVSDALELIAKAGDDMGFTRSELAMLELNDLFAAGTREQVSNLWKEKIRNETEKLSAYAKLVLPPIITTLQDFEIVSPYRPRPNYITNKTISSQAVRLGENERIPDLEGKIVLIESADPGYDWIFTRTIAGLITKYGGVASHMSIRCAEFGIPAAIGAGALFDEIRSTDTVILDCKRERIQF